MGDRDKKMERSVSQSLYKYLPESWIDFSSDKLNYTARVDHWVCDHIEGINTKRLLRKVNRAVQSYQSQEDPEGSSIHAISPAFMEVLTEENCDVLTPKDSEEGTGIVAKIDPLTFFCEKCQKVYQFENEESFNRSKKICENDHKRLTQFRQIYFCKCGYATGVHPECRVHGTEYLYKTGDYEFTCRKCKKSQTIQMERICPNCGGWLGPKNALDSSQYFVYSLNLIDLITVRCENFISKWPYGKYITLAYWAGRIQQEELNNIIVNDFVEKYLRAYEQNFHDLEQSGASISTVTEVAQMKALQEAEIEDIVEDAEEIKEKLLSLGTQHFEQHAEMILEYNMLREGGGYENKDQVTYATIDTAIAMSEKLNTCAHPDEIRILVKQFGFADVRACNNIPFVTCSYGYTRVKSEYEPGVQLRAFPLGEGNKKNIFATQLHTEGVLFEFDRNKILEWLLKNNIVDESQMPDLTSNEDVKLWFINNIWPEEIEVFKPISETKSKETYYVYRLIHSISHLLIRAAAEIGGLGKDSLSEYIFPGIPAVLIYVQNSQGFNLGSLFHTFEAYLERWMIRALQDAQTCIYDPVCIERYKACTGCLFLNEVSCQHANKDLDRSLIIGHFDQKSKQRISGFWEEI